MKATALPRKKVAIPASPGKNEAQAGASDEQGIAGYHLENSLPYLLNRIGVRISDLFEHETSLYGLTVPMYRAIAALAERDSRNLGELGDAVSVETSTLSRMVGVLEKKGFVIRRRRKDNARAVSIELTKHGRRVALELIPKAIHFEKVAGESIGIRELAKLREQLVDIYHSLDKIAIEQSDRADLPSVHG